MTWTFQEIIDQIQNDLDENMDFNMDKAELVRGYLEMLKVALDRKNRAIEHFKDPVVSMAQTRRLVEQAKEM